MARVLVAVTFSIHSFAVSQPYIYHLPSRHSTTPSNANTIYFRHAVWSPLQTPCCSPSCLSLTSYAILTIFAAHATVPPCTAFGCKGHHSQIYPFPINTINTMSIESMELETWELEAWYTNGPMPEAMAKSSFRVHVGDERYADKHGDLRCKYL